MIDATVLIDLLQGKETAKKYVLSTNQPLTTSRIVVMEIIAGCRSKREVKANLELLRELGVEVTEIDEAVSQQAGDIFETYYHQFGLGIADALIAATALVRQEELVTHNTKHFRFIPELKLTKPY